MVPGKGDFMTSGVDVSGKCMGSEMLAAMTSKVVAKVPRLEPPALQERIKDMLSPIYNFEEVKCLEVPFIAWVEAMWSIATAARSISVGQLLPRHYG
mmetsp:Transcript_77098/g.172524  ORF Transcript_77098/g.172524 Transcript_77098/m.172524 type:complete len:97 (+) Transcript_77098:1-291(+)